MNRQYVRFRTDEASYIIALDAVKEIALARDIRPLPSPRAGIIGLMQHQGEVITVIAALGGAPNQVVIVVNAAGALFGLLATEVVGLVDHDDANLAPPPPGQQLPLIEGMMILADRVDRLVSPALIWDTYGA